VPTRSLPADPSVEQLRTLAKTLLRLAREGEPGAVELVREFHPRHRATTAGGPGPAGLTLSDMQLTLARSYGLASWPKLREHVLVVNRLTRNPHRQPVGEPVGSEAELVDELLRLACLTYGADDPSRPERARALLADHPELATATIHTIAAVGDAAAARARLADDPSLASAEGGPHRWVPLLYLAYSRLDDPDPDPGAGTGGARDALEVARLLLAAGADPNAGYLWESAYPFTALTGAFGEGENGVATPPHPHALALARLLLEAGADANDSQTLYNRQWNPGDEHLELLLEHGLGRGAATVWHARLGLAEPTPQQLVEEELRGAAERGRMSRVRLLVDVVDDLDGLGTDHPLLESRTAHELAVLHGHVEVAALLEARGARPRPMTPVDELRAAALRADAAEVERLTSADPDLADQLIAAVPDLPGKAAELDRIDAIELLVALGYDLDPTGRRTPLHEAAFHGNLDLVRALLALGADPNVRDPHFDSTPAGWAAHNQRHDVARHLAALETPEPPEHQD
jgi:ankyrin repeat protein